ncbi:MAG: hypothetical protein J6K95_08230 [Rikenellaceae bacterium]|nr:hypothetical protein [Rikenellaceae bacterium]
MKKSRSLIVLAALLSAVGCGRPAGGEGTVCINPLEATVEVASLDGYIEQVEYIPLSAEDSASYVTRVRKVIPAGDRWVVLAGNLLVFDAGGRFETMYCMASDEKSLYWVYSDYGECPDSDPAMHPLHRYLREHGAPVLSEDANPVLVRVRFKL